VEHFRSPTVLSAAIGIEQLGARDVDGWLPLHTAARWSGSAQVRTHGVLSRAALQSRLRPVIEVAPQVVHLLVTRGEPRQLHALTALSRCKYCALLAILLASRVIR
jgi:hypothetical protein